jgi:16S rRNA (cytosine967-C5)-methyltransferase
MSRVDAPRRAALQILREVRSNGAYANIAATSVLADYGLFGKDAAFTTELAFGTLRLQGWYDRVLSACISRDWNDVQNDLKDILRMGAHQLLDMRVPDHAAVDTSCELARDAGEPGGAKGRAGFVNAVLRKVSARDTDEWRTQLRLDGDDLSSLAARTSHPEWVARALADSLGARRAELAELLEADNAPARPVLVARPGRMSVDELLGMDGIEPAPLSPLAGVLVKGAPGDLADVRSGVIGVQDEGSQLVALALTRAQVEGPETAWLDMCAGPGGKAAILEGIALDRGAELTAVEQHGHRADLVAHSLHSSRSHVITGDAATRPWGSMSFDRVLVDVPCTGLGALRRRPESRWRRTPEDLAALAPIQRQLLNAAIDATRPGGVIAYVTCSPHLAETEFVVSDVLRKRGDVEQEDARALLPEVADCGEGPAVQLWPHRHGTDAMFLALLRKK